MQAQNRFNGPNNLQPTPIYTEARPSGPPVTNIGPPMNNSFIPPMMNGPGSAPRPHISQLGMNWLRENAKKILNPKLY